MSKWAKFDFGRIDIKFADVEATMSDLDERTIDILKSMSDEGRKAWVESYKRSKGIRELPHNVQKVINSINRQSAREYQKVDRTEFNFSDNNRERRLSRQKERRQKGK